MNYTDGRLNSIHIEGFKSIKKCALKLNDINILIGSNGAGKSNFISIFDMLRHILNKNLQLYVSKNSINSLLFKGRKITNNISLKFFFGNNSYGFDLVPTNYNTLIFEKEIFGFDGRSFNAWAYDDELGSGHSESLWRNGTDNKINEYIYPILERNSWRVYHFHDTGDDSKIKQDHNISNNKELMFDCSNLAAFLYRLKNHYYDSYKKIVSTIKFIAPFFDDFELEPNEGNNERITLKWKQRSVEDIFNASQLSDGTLRFICLTTLLLQPLELQPPTIIIDEPELGLHPFAITMFAEMVRSRSSDKQFIISTQSIEVLNEFQIDDIVVVDRKNDSSHFKRLEENEFIDWLNDEYTLGDLWQKNLLGGRP